MSYEHVNHPKHYNLHPSGVETIEVIRLLGCNLAFAFKYAWRAGLKPSESDVRDMKKARWYLKDEREQWPADDVCNLVTTRRENELMSNLSRVVNADPDPLGPLALLSQLLLAHMNGKPGGEILESMISVVDNWIAANDKGEG